MTHEAASLPPVPIDPDTLQPGDWVRFYRNGRLVIGVVQYFVPRQTITRYVDTDEGAVAVERIRELRRAAPRRAQDPT